MGALQVWPCHLSSRFSCLRPLPWPRGPPHGPGRSLGSSSGPAPSPPLCLERRLHTSSVAMSPPQNAFPACPTEPPRSPVFLLKLLSPFSFTDVSLLPAWPLLACRCCDGGSPGGNHRGLSNPTRASVHSRCSAPSRCSVPSQSGPGSSFSTLPSLTPLIQATRKWKHVTINHFSSPLPFHLD